MSTAYLGPISYYRELLRGGEIQVDEAYEKQTYRNRCELAGAQGRLRLVVPVKRTAAYKAGLGPMVTRELKIEYQHSWQHQHWQSIKSAYRLSPYFDYVAEDLAPVYERQWTYLVDLNQRLHEIVMDWMQLPERLTSTKPEGFEPYWQVFGAKNGFLEDLSILDLLMCQGPEGVRWI